MRYRVDELADRSGLSVDTVRYYQARRLIPPPDREGRVVWYGAEHLEGLIRVRELKARGFSLAMVARVLAGELDASGQALAVALADPPTAPPAERRLDLEELGGLAEVSPTLLEALEREGLLVPRDDSERPYSEADAGAVRAGMALLSAGVPLSELLALAREHDAAMRAIADRAVDLFARFVRDPLRGAGVDEVDAGEQMVEALRTMLPAADVVVGHHFRRRLLAAARARLERPDHPEALDVAAG